MCGVVFKGVVCTKKGKGVLGLRFWGYRAFNRKGFYNPFFFFSCKIKIVKCPAIIKKYGRFELYTYEKEATPEY